jgi:hypothetical protein
MNGTGDKSAARRFRVTVEVTTMTLPDCIAVVAQSYVLRRFGFLSDPTITVNEIPMPPTPPTTDRRRFGRRRSDVE